VTDIRRVRSLLVSYAEFNYRVYGYCIEEDVLTSTTSVDSC